MRLVSQSIRCHAATSLEATAGCPGAPAPPPRLGQLHLVWGLLSPLEPAGVRSRALAISRTTPIARAGLALPFGGRRWERQRERPGRYTATSKRRASRAQCSRGCAAAEAEEISLPRGVAFHFRQCGELVVADDNSVEVYRSPLVTVFVPQVRRGILWTVGEVHFWATPLRQL